MIPRDFVQTLLSRIDIVDVIQGYLPLRKGGANYMARCPFHDEKSASFSVSPSKQFYYCFGCGATGSAIGFLIEHAGLSFPDAVRQLAEQAGMTVPDERPRREQPEPPPGESPQEFLRLAMDFYRARLREHPPAIDYLKRRGLTGQIAAKFGLGYAPAGWRALEALFPRYDHPGLLQAGLVIDGEKGSRYDRFRDRVMFPILDARGNVIGFGGRVMDAGEPKYLNSPETPLFEKGRELYGLFQAKPAIRAGGTVVVVEGYMDVVALAQHGIPYAVATLGTATTPHHFDRLLKLAERVVFSFDGDKAGRRAARRALEVSLPWLKDGKDVAFLFLPAEHDPDSYVRAHGAPAFEALLADATPLSRFLVEELRREHPEEHAEGRAALLHQAVDWIAEVRAPALSLLLRQAVAEAARVPRSDIDQLLQALGPPQPAPALAARAARSDGSAQAPVRKAAERGARSAGFPDAGQDAGAPARDHDLPPGEPPEYWNGAGGSEYGPPPWEAERGAGGEARGKRSDFKGGRGERRPPLGAGGRRETPISLEDTLVACLMQAPELVHTAHPDPADADLAAPALAAVADFIRTSHQSPTLAAFIEGFRDGPHERAIDRAVRRALPALQGSEPAELAAVLQDGLLRLHKQVRERELKALIERERRGEASDEDRQRLREWLIRAPGN
ncbi:MAG: DNA primase [Leptothrix sp. (in: b-proteobacteria)]